MVERHRLLEEVRGVPMVPEGAVEDHEVPRRSRGENSV